MCFFRGYLIFALFVIAIDQQKKKCKFLLFYSIKIFIFLIVQDLPPLVLLANI